MLDPATMAIVTGAAGTLVASMVSGGSRAARAGLVRLFRHDTPEAQRDAIATHDNDERILIDLACAAEADATFGPELALMRERITQAWVSRLHDHVSAHPEAWSDLQALAEASRATNVGTQLNSGSGMLVNGNIFGGVHNTYGAEPR
ncbi:hypothetical protein [Embleya sp. NPDC020630]|uniref:hypothetical protein n=1 Tax=Embleya sp. NPDC020630 TaxID=3363979 RepID=UPI0037900E48